MRIIGLTGGKGCGKSSVAKIISKNYGYEIVSFATPIKDMLRVLGLRDQELNDPLLKEIKLTEYGKTPRQLMQLLGTEFGRAMISQRIWITALEKTLNPSNNYVIDDVRFNNEAEFIRSLGGPVIEVRRTKIDNGDYHISEAGLGEDFIDGTIDNISPLEMDLILAVENTMGEIVDGFVYNREFRQ